MNLVEDWESIEAQTQWCKYGVYQTKNAVKGVEVRVRMIRFGHKRPFQSQENKEQRRAIRSIE